MIEPWEADDHVDPNEFEGFDPWEDNEDDDLIPPYEVDEDVPENIENGNNDWQYDRDDLYDTGFKSVSDTIRQPATDIRFEHLRIGDEYEITTDWKPYKCGAEKMRLTVMARTDDLKGFTKLTRLYMGRFREKAVGKYSLNDRLPGDKWSAGGRKLQVAVRSMVAGESVIGVPDEAVSFVTIDFAATPELSIWLEAGGAKPEDVFNDGMKCIDAALQEVGAVHVLREGFSEVSQAVNADEDNERCAVYAKAFARERWPEGLSWDDYSDRVFVPHIHAVFVLLDEDGQPIPAERFAEALRKQFPLPRAVRVETPRDTRWGDPGASVSKKVAAFIRYNIAKNREITQAEIVENIRWNKELQPEHIFFSGWTSFVEVRAMAVPIMRASLLSRHKLQEALVDFDIGPGRRIEAPPEIATKPVERRETNCVVVRLDDYRRPPRKLVARRGGGMDLQGPGLAILHQDWPHWAIANDNKEPVSTRAGPVTRSEIAGRATLRSTR